MCRTKLWLPFVVALIQWTHYSDGANITTADPGNGVIVQLYRWRYDDVAKECEGFLAKKGYAAVEVGPITEHIMKPGLITWDEPYYPVSYKITSRSGDEKAFKDMVASCNKAGIKVYVSVVLDHMARATTSIVVGYSNATADSDKYQYPGVPYTADDFTQPSCTVTDSTNSEQTIKCDEPEFRHLNHSRPEVREKLRAFLNKVTSFGVAGFSIFGVNRIHPEHLSALLTRLRHLNISHGFDCEAQPYFYNEYGKVLDKNHESAKRYYKFGRLADNKLRQTAIYAFRGYIHLRFLYNEIRSGRLSDLGDDGAVVYIDSPVAHQLPYRSYYKISYQDPMEFIPAVAFMLAYPYGVPRIMSSFNFETGVPVTGSREISSITLIGENCTDGWVCEHRWPAVYNMVEFRRVVGDANVTNFWTDGLDSFAFARDKKGFIIFNGNRQYIPHMRTHLDTTLPKGEYCDVITGTLKDGKCTGKTISVVENGLAQFTRYSRTDVGVTAIHIEAKLK